MQYRTVFRLKGVPDIAFLTEEEAYSYDLDNNPELHTTEEASFSRFEQVCDEIPVSDLGRIYELRG